MAAKRVLFCYLSGCDLRRLDGRSTPFLSDAVERYPFARLTNLPSNELFPTLITGVDPVAHGVWGVKLRSEANGIPPPTWLDRVPEHVAAALQCGIHLVNGEFDLAAIPPRRRRRFEIARTKYKRRAARPEALFRIGGVPTLFDVVGAAQSGYRYHAGYDPERTVLPSLCGDPYRLEVLELYSLDRYQQWNLDRPDAVARFYARVDRFLQRLHAKCEARGWTLLLVSDHGHEPIRRSYDLKRDLVGLDIPPREYDHFVEVSSARFWFHTDRARKRVLEHLEALEGASVLGHGDMHRVGVPLRDASYGEVFVYLDPGGIFFPHDFHHPLANLWLGLTDPMQRARLRDPRHRGNHGHLPHFEAERSFLLGLDPGFTLNASSGSILDVAPTVLALLGCDRPASMKGRPLARALDSPLARPA